MKTNQLQFKGLLILLLAILVNINSCKKEVEEPQNNDGYYTLTPLSLDTSTFNVVLANFHLKNSVGKIFGPLEKNNFSYKENGNDISESVNFRKVPELDIIYRTLILVDVSLENASNIADIQFAIKEYIKGINENEIIAIYTFSGEIKKIIGFTNNKQQLLFMTSGIGIGATSRNLYGALSYTLPKINIENSLEIERGSILLITNGDDNAGLSSLQDVINKRENKSIYTFNTKIDESTRDNLKSFSNGTYREIGKITNLAANLIDIHKTIINNINNFYQIKYKSHQFGNKNNKLEINFLNGTSSSDQPSCSFSFNSESFIDIGNLSLSLNVETDSIEILEDNPQTLIVTTTDPIMTPVYQWTSSDYEVFEVYGYGSEVSVIATGDPGETATITVKDITNQLELSIVCKIWEPETAIFIDPRDGKSYNILLLGEKWWFAENLTYESTNSYYYDNSSANAVYGRLYTIEDALSSCPSGWSLASDEDWKYIEGFFDSSFDYPNPIWDEYGARGDNVGGNMKDASDSYWQSPNTGGEDIAGFTALPGGEKLPSGEFQLISRFGYFWTSTTVDSKYIYRTLKYSTKKIFRLYNNEENIAFSVRCVKD